MAIYPTNEVHHVEGENHNALYMVVGIILALMLAGFVFFYNNSSSYFGANDTAGTRVENTITTPEPAAGTPAPSTSATESNSLDMRVDNGGVSATSTTTQQ